ncbi:hypothetical protein ACRAWF_24235 [Streptomyces sp. L7]
MPEASPRPAPTAAPGGQFLACAWLTAALACDDVVIGRPNAGPHPAPPAEDHLDAEKLRGQGSRRPGHLRPLAQQGSNAGTCRTRRPPRSLPRSTSVTPDKPGSSPCSRNSHARSYGRGGGSAEGVLPSASRRASRRGPGKRFPRHPRRPSTVAWSTATPCSRTNVQSTAPTRPSGALTGGSPLAEARARQDFTG